uniref:Uncharacterized protein n=1 Tax=Grammatophora oceanica TaxID=210454 RepID=A0A7S1YFD3_9STRA|eukprot:CAMPEP_0194046504 /NCGR_PEP_ID=MMETSP0009_2-20130614/21328_1 /TAXON_ID=210454 /ORGANISM="Grammatophora oceanica, Strain CCMP 410" /LENGTH=307 /DNA_ID=CAMNT_0038691819 /DNA_START=35 /DNA_END=958 /DNA_ORIENTATION=+
MAAKHQDVKGPLDEMEWDGQQYQDYLDATMKEEMDAKLAEEWEEEQYKKVERIYYPLRPISGISNDTMNIRAQDDAEFVQYLAENEYMLDTVENMFANARKHVMLKLEPSEHVVIHYVVSQLRKRSDYYDEVVKEMRRNPDQYSLEVAKEAFGATQAFMIMLAPFELEDADDQYVRIYTHFQDITYLYQRLQNAFGEMIKIKREWEEKERDEGMKVALEDKSLSKVMSNVTIESTGETSPRAAVVEETLPDHTSTARAIPLMPEIPSPASPDSKRNADARSPEKTTNSRKKKRFGWMAERFRKNSSG